jgi:hypothetical protein
MENILNGWINVLNLKMRDMTRSTKIFYISQLTVAYIYIERERERAMMLRVARMVRVLQTVSSSLKFK